MTNPKVGHFYVTLTGPSDTLSRGERDGVRGKERDEQ
jgi:hypothetical protein